MYRILIPIDNDKDRVSAQAETVLELLDVAEEVKVTLLHVFGDEERADETSPSQLSAGREINRRLTDAGATVEQQSRTGTPAEEILRTAREIGANQIVLGGRKRSPLGAVVFGSVSQDVIRKAPLPVTVTGSAQNLDRPTHRCADCGEVYYVRVESDISSCRGCGGVNVERISDEPAASSS